MFDEKSENIIQNIKDEKVDIVTNEEERSYFILDSADYWYDIIQESYLREKKCSCKTSGFLYGVI